MSGDAHTASFQAIAGRGRRTQLAHLRPFGVP
jgi:hypothetical protein